LQILANPADVWNSNLASDRSVEFNKPTSPPFAPIK
jgi:hypothetical protein